MNDQDELPAYLERHRILSIEVAARLLGFSTSHLRRLYRTGKFPKPLQIGSRKLGYKAGLLMDLTNLSQRED